MRRLILAALLVAACAGAAPAITPTWPLASTPVPTALLAASQSPAIDTRPIPASVAVPTPTAQPTPSPTLGPTPAPLLLDPPAKAGKFAMDIYRERAHVRQATRSMCVPASMQIMINLMRPDAVDRSREFQDELYALARSYSPWLTPERGGASARGWAGGLDQLGYGNFDLTTEPTMDEALRTAARQMRLTGKPVGLLVWRGDHAWVMSGFKATADPAWTDDYEVTAVWIEDPWFGRTDRTWGTGLAPHTLVGTEALRADFVSWTTPHLSFEYGIDRFYMVLPRS